MILASLMSLAPGVRLGPYEIQSAIGAGGMGEVYKARDTRLDRTVAIKVLPSQLAGDPQFRERFDREAHAIAALNHPHICTLYDVGHQDPSTRSASSGSTVSNVEPSTGSGQAVDFLVMEYLEGETLADRLQKGALPLDRALTYAIEIAGALDKAHRHGITHRDLKPGNIMLTTSGTKLLDFGLAKLRPTGAPGAVALSAAPTVGSPLTGAGSILGTFQYMAPEQLEGKDADARTDLFALGALLYEMLTGKKAFEGKSQASLISAIMSAEPVPIAQLQPLAPPQLDHLVRRCLAKDPDARWQTARDLEEELRWVTEGGGVGADSVRPPIRAARREAVVWSVAAVALIAAAALAIPAARHLRESAPDPLPTRFEIPTPPTSDPVSFALSADGRQLAFVATSEGAPRLWVRLLDQVDAQPLPGTEGASYPFWAPDGRAIGFFADGKLKRIDLGSGSPQVLADAPSGRGGTWNRDGVLVFAPAARDNSPLMRVMATGGTPVAVTRLAPGQGSHRWPQFLPDGRHFLFLVAYGRSDTQGVYVGTLDGGEPTRVLAAETAAVYAPPGALLWVRQGVLVAVRFDPAREVVSGEPIPVAQAVGLDGGVLRGAFAVSATGVLAHRAGGGEQRQLTWVDRAGIARGTVGQPDENGLSSPELAPDGRRVAVFRTVQGNSDVWLIDSGRGVPSRFTFDASNTAFPQWSPDGSRVVFASDPNGVFDLFEKPLSGAGDEQPLLVTADNKNPLAWSPDGRVLLYATQNPKTGTDLWALPLTGDRKPPSFGASLSPPNSGEPRRSPGVGGSFPVVQTPFEEAAGQFSPDGRWVAYQSNESGPVQIYVRPFPGPGGQWQMSTAGGSQPRWRPDGKELFYVAPDARLMAVSIAVGADRQTLEAGAPVPLFATRLASGANIPGGVMSKPQYAVASDGRFLMNVAVEGATAPPITVVLNWDAALLK